MTEYEQVGSLSSKLSLYKYNKADKPIAWGPRHEKCQLRSSDLYHKEQRLLVTYEILSRKSVACKCESLLRRLIHVHKCCNLLDCHGDLSQETLRLTTCRSWARHRAKSKDGCIPYNMCCQAH